MHDSLYCVICAFFSIPYFLLRIQSYCFSWCEMVSIFLCHSQTWSDCVILSSYSLCWRSCSHCGLSTRLFHSINFILLKFTSCCLFTLPLLVDAAAVSTNTITIGAVVVDSLVEFIFQAEERTKHTSVVRLRITTIRYMNRFAFISKHML